MTMLKALVALFALLAGSVQTAKTDLAGCTLTVVPLLTEIVTTTVNGVVSSYGDYGYTTFQWDGTEQCQLIDCGGGRAPPKTDVPGCPLYTGTGTVPSLPFPTASLTLVQAAATTTPAPALSAVASATPGSASPSSLASNTVAPVASQSTLAAPLASTASTQPAAISPAATTGSASASQASDLNPTASGAPNDALRIGGRWEMVLPGLGAVAIVALLA